VKSARRRSFAGAGARAALVPPAAFAVHQLRFTLAFGKAASVQLQITGHSYLHSLVPWIVGLLGLSAGLFLRALGRTLAGRTQTAGRAGSFLTLWLACTAALIGIYTAQELLEGAFLVGHVPGLAGAFGMGGGWAIPAAAGVGLVLAAIYCGAHAVLAEATRRAAITARAATEKRPIPRRPAAPLFTLTPAPLAAGWSLRGPPTVR
jgi:hypothetical protein